MRNVIDSHPCRSAINAAGEQSNNHRQQLRRLQWQRRAAQEEQSRESEAGGEEHHAFNRNIDDAGALAPDAGEGADRQRRRQAQALGDTIVVRLVSLPAAAAMITVGMKSAPQSAISARLIATPARRLYYS